MRFHPLAVFVVVVGTALVLPTMLQSASSSSSSSSYATIVDAFIIPIPYTYTQTTQQRRTNRKTKQSINESILFGIPESSYLSLENGNPKTPSSSSPKPTPKRRGEKLRTRLEADVTAAEESKGRIAQQLLEAEQLRASLAAEEVKASNKAEAMEQKLKAFERKQGAANSAGFLGIVGEIAAPIAGGFFLAAARKLLTERSEKVEAERIRIEEEQRRAAEVEELKIKEQKEKQDLLPVLSAGVIGLGVFGTLLGGGGGSGTIVDIMKKNALQDVLSQQGDKINLQQSKTSSGLPSALITSEIVPVVELPYLEKEIAKFETKPKQQQKRIPRTRPKSQKVLEREATEEQRAIESRLETRLSEAPARKAAERLKVAKEKEDARIKAETESKEKEGARLKAEAKDARIKIEIEAKEKEIARLEEVSRLKNENQARLIVEKEAKDNEQARFLREKEDAVALELLKKQNTQSNGILPKVPAVSQILFGEKKPSEITDKGLSTIFDKNEIVIGGVALAGLAVAAAVIAANESPSVSATFKVTGKSPKEILETPDSASSSSRRTTRIPTPGKVKNGKEKESSEKASKTASSSANERKNKLRDELSQLRDNLSKQAAGKISSVFTQSPSSNTLKTSTNSSTKKTTSVVGESKSLSGAPVEDYSPDSTYVDTPTILPSTLDFASEGTSSFEGKDKKGPESVKKSFSPFQGRKPTSVSMDSLSSPVASESISSARNESYLESPESMELLTTSPTKKPYSSFGEKKPPMSATMDPLTSQEFSSLPTTDEVSVDPSYLVSTESIESSTGLPMKKSYSPFREKRPPMSATMDPLSSPEISATFSDFISSSVTYKVSVDSSRLESTENMEVSNPSPMKKSYSPFREKQPPISATMDPLSSQEMSETFSAFISSQATDEVSVDSSYLDSTENMEISNPSPTNFPSEERKPPSVLTAMDPVSFSAAPESFLENTETFSEDAYRSEGTESMENEVNQSFPSSQKSFLPSANRSYTNDLSTGFAVVAPKKSFSPFGKSKPVAAISNLLYSAPEPQISQTKISNDSGSILSDEVKSNAIQEKLTSFTRRKSFTPFQGRKPVAATNDSLYSSPSIQHVEKSESDDDSIQQTDPTVNDLSYSNSIKKEESSPSIEVDDASSIEEERIQPQAKPAILPPQGIKKSFSPFGVKPDLLTNDSRSSSNDGYLDGI